MKGNSLHCVKDFPHLDGVHRRVFGVVDGDASPSVRTGSVRRCRSVQGDNGRSHGDGEVQRAGIAADKGGAVPQGDCETGQCEPVVQ